ncbi:amidohydrolase [Flagelloscypha sp. PMI_526]|nr:amidohydrolase [Flagelloscypha sp. PMI_526]
MLDWTALHVSDPKAQRFSDWYFSSTECCHSYSVSSSEHPPVELGQKSSNTLQCLCRTSPLWSIAKTHLSPPPSYSPSSSATEPFLDEKVLKTLDDAIDDASGDLRKLSLAIHDHPEMKWEEVYAHDTLTDFMQSQGFKVTRHYLGIPTAWRAEYSFGSTPRRVAGVNAEMDALPNGHSCGHNLIAAGGVGIALALKTALEKHKIDGKVVLLGTPAEEGGGGKIELLKKGAYDDMDACVMMHPMPGPDKSGNLGSSTAIQAIQVVYTGQSAHAAAAPWEGTNALDAAFVAYSAISALRQQTPPTHRVHGIVSGQDWAPNVIPDCAKLSYIVRAPSVEELDVFVEKVVNCLKAGALATSCKMELEYDTGYSELRQNAALGDSFISVMDHRYGFTVVDQDTPASTDFGNVTYKLPSLHPGFSIPTVHNGGNHTPEFAEAAATLEAHQAMLTTTKGLSAVALKFLADDKFAKEVQDTFDSRTRD